MDMGFSETSSPRHTPLVKIHGFRVQSYGKRLSPGFQKGLKRLAERGFDDPTCVVVKTGSGNRSGITHAGGRYVHAGNCYAAEVMRMMRDLGMEPPPLPFVIAPGEYTLYHEWGHHVDDIWSRDDEEVTFSFRWFSRFYELGVRTSTIARPDQASGADYRGVRPIESDTDAASAVVVWRHASSELFADLFEDWMRAEKKVAWDQSEPENMRAPDSRADVPVMIGLLPGVRADDVRAETYILFMAGIRSAGELPPIRPGLFGPSTDETIGRLREVLARARTGRL
jgi:hypothetical protein